MAGEFDPFERIRTFQQVAHRPTFGQGLGGYQSHLDSIRDERAREEQKKQLATYALRVGGSVVAGARSAGYSSPSSPASSDIQKYVQGVAAKRGWTGSQWNALADLIQKESGWRLHAQNPKSSAADLFQFLDSTRRNYGIRLHDSLENQVRAGFQYIEDRYGTPQAALAHWLARKPINGRDVGNWY